jgi:formate-dependent nitrite reductase cytochrome c552 subunit
LCQTDSTWYTFHMTKNKVSLAKTHMIGTCDGCEETRRISATDDGRALMCEECRIEYNKQMAE